MWFYAVFFLSIFSAAQSIKYEDSITELLSFLDTPASKDLERLHRFKEDISEFSRKMAPIAESFVKIIEPGEKPFRGPIYNITKRISDITNGAPKFSWDYKSDAQHEIRVALSRIQMATIGRGQEHFTKMCLENHGLIERKIEEHAGSQCLQTSFSPKTASMLFESIDSFKYLNHTLSKKRDIFQKSDQARFQDLYAALYFHLERFKGRLDNKLRAFIEEKKGDEYENKLKLLEELMHFFGIDEQRPPTSPCLPLTVFLESHFDRDYLLLLGDVLMNDIYATKFFTHICAAVIKNGNAKAAEMYLKTADEILSPVYSVLTEWFDSLQESTWPVTETELIKGFMKEASGGRQVKERTIEYQRIANIVHNRMKSIGHPKYFRQFLVTNEYPVAVESPNFDYNCKENSCSRAVSDGAQCITLRNPRDKRGLETTEFENFVNFTETIKPKILDVLDKGYKNAPEVVNHLYLDHNVSLSTFVNHSSYIGFHKNQYFGNCRIFYGYKSEEEEKSSHLRAFRNHRDTRLFSNAKAVFRGRVSAAEMPQWRRGTRFASDPEGRRMWFRALFFLSIFFTAECGKYDDAAKELLPFFDTPESKDLGRLHTFKEELSKFSRKMVPIAESVAESIKKGNPLEFPFENMTEHILNIIEDAERLSSDYQFDVQNRILVILMRFPIDALGSLEFFSKRCLSEHGQIERMMEKVVGKACLQTSFSQKTASVLLELIDSFQFLNFTLSNKKETYFIESEQNRFKTLYAALYFHLERNKEFDLLDGKLRAFIRVKTGFKTFYAYKLMSEVGYENKVKLLEDMCHFLGIDISIGHSLPTSLCSPLALFLNRHFDRDYLLRLGDTLINDIYAAKFIVHICANITNYGNPKGAEEYVKATDEKLDTVYSVLTEWFESLMESTWPETETHLIKGFMKEVSEGREVKETTAEYQRIANIVHARMKSIGHPGYIRQFLVTKEYSIAVDSPNFDYKCRENSCSRSVTDGAQCVTLRIPKDKSGHETTEFQNFVNFTERVKPKILELLDKGYKYAPEVVNHLYHDHSVALTTFVNHSSYIVFHKNMFFGNCRVFYGYKSEEEEWPMYLRVFRNHRDTRFFSKCHDWLFFLGF